jgi:hypothetical protein
MRYRKLLVTLPFLVSVALTACSDATAPNQLALGGQSLVRSGALRVTKACAKTYHGLAGDFCTITSSNLKEIEIGSTITYASAVSSVGFLETDVVLDLPGPGNNVAFGHCSVDLTAINGTMGCVFSGGTGKFTWFHADVKLSLVDPDDPATELVWNGRYSFRPGH